MQFAAVDIADADFTDARIARAFGRLRPEVMQMDAARAAHAIRRCAAGALGKGAALSRPIGRVKLDAREQRGRLIWY